MDSSFTIIEVVPSTTQFGLNQLRRSYKSTLSASAATAAAPAIGTADETFGNMYLTSVTTPESGEIATRIDLVYQGVFGDPDDDGLPLGQSESDLVPKSATSQAGGVGGFSVAAPVTVNFNGPSNTMTWVSNAAGALGPSGDVPDPDDADLEVTGFIYTFASIPFGFTGDLYAFWLTNLFVILLTTTLKSTEIVQGQYWLNVKTKTKVYASFQTFT